MEGKSNPGRYYKCAVPHDSVEAANEAVKGFREEVDDLREKYKLPNLVVVIDLLVEDEEGTIHTAPTSFCCGDSNQWLSMLAFAFGQEKASSQERTMKAITTGMKVGAA